MTPLYGHVSQETARLVEDYPYGGKRCRIRFWIEEHSKRGFRFVSQTENPNTHLWNNPKQGSYCLMGMALYLDEKNHVQHRCLTEYSSVDEVLSFLKDFAEAPVSFNLKALVTTRYRMTERTSNGEHNFTIAKTPQMPNDDDIAKAKVELTKWREVLDLIKARSPKV